MAIQDDIRNLDDSIARLEEAALRLQGNFNDIATELGTAARNSTDFGATLRTAAQDTNDLARLSSKLRGITKDELKDKQKSKHYPKPAAEVARTQAQTQQTIAF